MRIAMVSEHASPLAALGGEDAGGQNVHVAALSTALAGRGAEVVVFTRRDDPAPGRRVAMVHPGAASPARRWPPERFAAVARAEARMGREVVVTGGAGEVELAHQVTELAGLPPSASLAGQGDLLALARAVAAAGRVVCGDTGVAHLATALGTPSVVLFGPVPPTEWGPPPDRPWHLALWAGSRGDPHGLRPDPGLLQISVGEVLEALASLPGRPARGVPG